MVALDAFASPCLADESLGIFARLAESGGVATVDIFVTSDEAPRADTVKWSLPVTARTGDGFRPVTAEGERWRVSVFVECVATSDSARDKGGVVWLLSGVLVRCNDPSVSMDSFDVDRVESIERRGESKREMELVRSCLLRLSIHPSPSSRSGCWIVGSVPLREAGAGVPATLASLSIRACCMSSGISRTVCRWSETDHARRR